MSMLVSSSTTSLWLAMSWVLTPESWTLRNCGVDHPGS